MTVHKIIQNTIFIIMLLLISACSPKYNWRQVKSSDPLFTAYFPEKPVEHSKQIILGDVKIIMRMTAAEVNGVNFAIAYVKTNEQNSQKIIQLMRSGMIKNINGTISESKIKNTLFIVGNLKSGKRTQLYARFTTKNNWAIQAIVIGEEKKIKTENLEMFFDSIKLQ
jgi:hypothetical protein